MAKNGYLDPAYTIIQKFSHSGRLSEGIDEVARIVGRHRSNVYRWMIPIERGGRGGIIPGQAQRQLFAYARKKRLGLEAADFFGARAA